MWRRLCLSFGYTWKRKAFQILKHYVYLELESFKFQMSSCIFTWPSVSLLWNKIITEDTRTLNIFTCSDGSWKFHHLRLSVKPSLFVKWGPLNVSADKITSAMPLCNNWNYWWSELASGESGYCMTEHWTHVVVFGRCLLQILARSSVILTGRFSRFSQSL